MNQARKQTLPELLYPDWTNDAPGQRSLSFDPQAEATELMGAPVARVSQVHLDPGTVRRNPKRGVTQMIVFITGSAHVNVSGTRERQTMCAPPFVPAPKDSTAPKVPRGMVIPPGTACTFRAIDHVTLLIFTAAAAAKPETTPTE